MSDMLQEGTERQSEIEIKSTHITETIQALSRAVKELEKRLEMVLIASKVVDERGKDTEDAEKAPINSPLGEQLLDYNKQLQGIHSSITDILQRLDL